MKKIYVTGLVILALISAVAAAIYFTHTAANLPGFFPGHSAGLARKHTKHGVAFIGLAVVLLLAAWMVSGNKDASRNINQTDGSQT